MENPTKVLNRQLSLNKNTNDRSKEADRCTVANNNLDVNNHNYNSINRDINRDKYKNFNQLRNIFPVNEVKFSDSKLLISPNENNNNHTNFDNHHNNDNCYVTVNGTCNEMVDKKIENGGTNDTKVKTTNFSTMDGDSILSAATSTTAINKKKQMPDGGYGWTIVFASFAISLIIDGIAFSFGLIFTELLAYFKESKTKTAWIGAFHLSVPLLAGPILSNLVDKYGCRVMTICGGLIAGIGFFLSAISTSVEMLYITFGLISGFGIGIGYVTAVVSIAFWFDKKRTFATSLGAAGTGIGTFLYAPFTNWLLETYGWRGTTLILAGTLLNVCVCGCLMRDPDWLIEENRLESRSQSMLTVSNSSVCLTEIRKMLETGTPGETVLLNLLTNVNTEANQQIHDLDKSNIFKRYRSESLLPTFLYSPEYESDVLQNHGSRRSLRRKDVDEFSRENVFSVGTLPSSPMSPAQQATSKTAKHLASAETLNPSEKYSLCDSINSIYDAYATTNHSQKCRSTFSLDESLLRKENSPNEILMNRKIRGSSLNAILENDTSAGDKLNDTLIVAPLLERNMERKNHERAINGIDNNIHHRRHKRHRHHNPTGEIVSNLRRNIPLRNSHHFQHMRIHRKAMNYRSAMLNTHRYHLKASSCPNIYRNSMTTLAKEEEEKWYDDFIDIIKSIFDFSMFLEPTFFFFNLSTFLLFIWYIVPYFYITDHLLRHTELNYTEADGANLISVIGVFNTIGMVILGYIGDKPWLNVSKTYAICLAVCGVSTALMPFFIYNYTYLVILGMIFGISFSSSFSFIPILLVQLVDLDDFTCAYGLVLLVQGVGSLIGPPLSGIIYDYTNRWDDAFYAAGFFIACSGVLAWVTGILVERDEEGEDDDEDEGN